MTAKVEELINKLQAKIVAVLENVVAWFGTHNVGPSPNNGLGTSSVPGNFRAIW